MSHVDYQWIAKDGLQIYGQSWEPENTPKAVICIVTGLGEHSGRYAYVAETFNNGGYAVIASDLRGHGKSAGKRGHAPNYQTFMDDLELLLEEGTKRYPKLPCFLWGHSLGGLFVLSYGLQRKPKLSGVVVTAPALRSPILAQKLKVQVAKIAGKLFPEMSMPTGLVANHISRDPEVVARYIQDPLVHSVSTLAMAKYTIEAIPWVFEHADEWTLPILIMQGDTDQITYLEGSKELVSKIQSEFTLKIWPGLAHEVHNEPEKDQVLAYALSWLDSHLS
jgi:acylglycerol lipase